MGSNKKTWMRIIILALAGIMIAGAVIMPFIR
jgi:hypothetical protein